LEGDLVLSRSFGDYIYKDYLSVEPDIYNFQISEEDKYLIMATDGF
jgi:protein phosphatase 1L